MKLTLIGFHEYTGGAIWDAVTLPTGIDKDILINTILLTCGEFEVIYPSETFLTSAIGWFFERNERTFSKWITAQNLEYDPIYNYDRHEEWTDTGSQTGATTNTVNQTSEIASSDNTTDNAYRSAYNTGGVQQTDRNTSESSGSQTGSGTTSENGTDKTDSTGTHTGHLYGNIGVTTSQQMLEAEYQIDAWNIYDRITEMFKNAFCVCVYY